MRSLATIISCCSIFLFSLVVSAQSTAPNSHATEFHVAITDSVNLWVKAVGNQKPVCIFVHGGPGAWSRSFEDLGGHRFESIFSMVYYDQRGCGRSDSARDYSLDRMARDIEAIRVSLHADKIYLLPHSFGGIIAQAYAALYPEQVQGLILMNCTLDIKSSLANQIGFINQLTNEHFPTGITDTIFSTFLQARKALVSVKLGYKMLSDHISTVDTLETIDDKNPGNFSFGQSALGMPEYFQDFTKNTPNIKVPVLILAGSKDHNIGPEHYKEFHFPNQKVVIIQGGHLAYYENTDEIINAIKHWM